MSYSAYRPRFSGGRGLSGVWISRVSGGPIPPGDNALKTSNITDHGQPWDFIGVGTTEFRDLHDAMVKLGLAARGNPPLMESGGTVVVLEDGPTVASLWKAYTRFGNDPKWWIYQLTANTEAKAIYDWGRMIRIHPQLREKIMFAASGGGDPWGLVAPWNRWLRIAGGSSLAMTRDGLMDIIAQRLIAGEYLPASFNLNAAFDSNDRFVGRHQGDFIGMANQDLNDTRNRGLWRAWMDLSNPGGKDAWHNDSFGYQSPLVDGCIGRFSGEACYGRSLDVLRIAPDFFKALMAPLPAEIRGVAARAGGVRRLQVAGSFPKVQ